MGQRKGTSPPKHQQPQVNPPEAAPDQQAPTDALSIRVAREVELKTVAIDVVKVPGQPVGIAITVPGIERIWIKLNEPARKRIGKDLLAAEGLDVPPALVVPGGHA